MSGRALCLGARALLSPARCAISMRWLATKVEMDPTADLTVHLTDSFAKRMAMVSGRDGRPRLLRLRVEPGGCDGFSYKWYVCDEADVTPEEDRLFEHGGQRCVIDSMSLDLVKGSTVDFVTELVGAEFKVLNNPNAVQKCSCGASFAPSL